MDKKLFETIKRYGKEMMAQGYQEGMASCYATEADNFFSDKAKETLNEIIAIMEGGEK